MGQSHFAGVVRGKTVRLRPALSPLPLVLKHLSCTLYPLSLGQRVQGPRKQETRGGTKGSGIDRPAAPGEPGHLPSFNTTEYHRNLRAYHAGDKNEGEMGSCRHLILRNMAFKRLRRDGFPRKRGP